MSKDADATEPQMPRQHTRSAKTATSRNTDISPDVLLRIEEVATCLLTFFTEAGIPAEIKHDWRLRINEDLTRPLSEFPAARAGKWREVADRLAWVHVRTEFTWSVLRNLPLPPPIIRTDLGVGCGFSISLHGKRIAVIHATSASVLGQHPVYANFLSYGPHWGQLAESLQIAWHVLPPKTRLAPLGLSKARSTRLRHPASPAPEQLVAHVHPQPG
jgi:hypothetical protein